MEQRKDKTLQVAQIASYEHFEYKGNVQINGNVGEEASIVIKGGSLTILGKVSSGANITLLEEQHTHQVTVSNGFWGSSVSVGNIGTALLIHCNVESYVTINTSNTSIKIGGNVDRCSQITLKNGSITAENIETGVIIKTMNGSITVKNMMNGSQVKTMNGSISANEVGEHCSLKTMNGSVNVRKADKTALLETANGSIYENGVKRGNATGNAQFQSVVSIGNMSFSGARIIINERDISNYRNNESPSDSTESSSNSTRSSSSSTEQEDVYANGRRLKPQIAQFFGQPKPMPQQKPVVQPMESENTPDCYICPITHEIMKDPVFLILDQRTYERSAITQWLKDNQSSPINRERMQPGQSIDTVLFSNRDLKNAIELHTASNADSTKKMAS